MKLWLLLFLLTNPVTKYFTNKSAVTIQHNLKTEAVYVNCYDNFSEPMAYGSVELIDSNAVVVYFEKKTTGRCEVWR